MLRAAPLRIGGFAIEICEDLPPLALASSFIVPDLTHEQALAAEHRFGADVVDASSMRLTAALQSFIVRTPTKTMLIETCAGNHRTRPGSPGLANRNSDYLERLARAGVAPEDVDVVFSTHLHVDHVGWNTRWEDGKWIPTFPNAEYVFMRGDFEFWKREHAIDPARAGRGAYADSVLPIVEHGQAHIVDFDHAFGPGLELELAPGHSYASSLLHVRDGGDHAVFIGDTIHLGIQLTHPTLLVPIDIDAEAGRRTRMAVMERYADTPTIVIASHFMPPVFGRIVREGDAYAFRYLESG